VPAQTSARLPSVCLFTRPRRKHPRLPDQRRDKLVGLLGKLVGVAGSRALLARALSLAKRETEALTPVSVTEDGTLDGFTGKAAEGSPVLIAHLIGLVVTFLGEALTLRLLHDVWPDRTASDILFGERNGNEPAQ
jgi:hypothetical protein